MKVSGTATLQAPAERVFAALHDPAVLVRTIPGCERLEALGDDRYRMAIIAKVASITGTYLGEVMLADPLPPSAFTLHATGSGTPGTVRADIRVTLDDRGDGTTLLRYDAEAMVGGPVGGVGQRVLSGVAKRTAGEFFEAVNAWLTGSGPEPAPKTSAAGGPRPGSSAPGTSAPGTSAPGTSAPGTTGTGTAGGAASGDAFRRSPGNARSPVPVTLRDQCPGILIGASIALLGVIIGWRLSRAYRRGEG